MRTGIVTFPLDYGRCPKWLFERMKRLARGIIVAIIEEFGAEEILKRFSDPVWFQSFGCILAFDWNSSGLTTTTLGAVKATLFDIQDEIGIYVCGGKGKTSRKTPEEIETYGISRGFSFAPYLIFASKIAAKVDSALLQDGFQIYHHNFLFSKSGNWVVVQQGMNLQNQTARRYHWIGSSKKNFIEEPHSGIITQEKVKPLNLTAKESGENREISLKMVKGSYKAIEKDLNLISKYSLKAKIIKTATDLSNIKKLTLPGDEIVPQEPIDLKFNTPYFSSKARKTRFFRFAKGSYSGGTRFFRFAKGSYSGGTRFLSEAKGSYIKKTIFSLTEKKPKTFLELLSQKGVGPKTIRALSLVAEIIYGTRPSYEDPARYSFAHGGKDAVPYPVDRKTYDRTISVIEKGIKKSFLPLSEKEKALQRLTMRYQSSNAFE